MEHTFTELLWLLLIYSFIGWIIEAAVGTIKNKKFTNRGFSTGPFCLVYGVAAVLMEITLSELIGSPFFLFLGCGIQATFVEWFTGKTLERMNRHKWWDYSDKKWNFDGYICPQYSLLWAVLYGNGATIPSIWGKRRMAGINSPTAAISARSLTTGISVWTGWCIRTGDRIRDFWN